MPINETYRTWKARSGSFLVSFHLRQRITIRPVVPQPHFHINLGNRIRTNQDLCTRTQPQQSP